MTRERLKLYADAVALVAWLDDNLEALTEKQTQKAVTHLSWRMLSIPTVQVMIDTLHKSLWTL